MSEEIQYKRATVKIPKISPSHSYIKLKKDNERVIRNIEKLERGPFGIKNGVIVVSDENLPPMH